MKHKKRNIIVLFSILAVLLYGCSDQSNKEEKQEEAENISIDLYMENDISQQKYFGDYAVSKYFLESGSGQDNDGEELQKAFIHYKEDVPDVIYRRDWQCEMNSYFFHNNHVYLKANAIYDDTIHSKFAEEAVCAEIHFIKQYEKGNLYKLAIEPLGELTDEKLINNGQIVCQNEEIQSESKERDLEFHFAISRMENQIEYSSCTITPNGEIDYYENFRWEERKGLIEFCSGYRAEREPLYLTEITQISEEKYRRLMAAAKHIVPDE